MTGIWAPHEHSTGMMEVTIKDCVGDILGSSHMEVVSLTNLACPLEPALQVLEQFLGLAQKYSSGNTAYRIAAKDIFNRDLDIRALNNSEVINSSN